MPELPEVETVVRTLKPQILGATIRDTRVLLPKAVQYGMERLSLLPGADIRDVCRRAKLLIIGLGLPPDGKAALPRRSGSISQVPECLRESDLLLVFHLKMTGRFFLHPPGTTPLKHTRLVFDLGGTGSLFFDDARTFGYCRIMSADELPCWPFWASLGPEPLGSGPEELATHLAQHLAAKRCSVKSALLDQCVVAGIGNIYADESLFKAGIDPRTKAGDVPRAKLADLAESLQTVLRQSIKECGSSIRDYRDALGNAGAFQNSFAVYGRKGEPCKRCGAELDACRLSGRATVFCPKCQNQYP